MTISHRLMLGFLCFCAVSIFSIVPRTVYAGPSYDLAWKVFQSDLIVEIEFTILPKSAGWPASNTEARKAKIVRTIFKKKGTSAPGDKLRSFPFSLLSKCWPEERTSARFLVFYSANEEVMGLENDEGGYSSLNEDYEQVVRAVSNAGRWDKDRDGKTDWAPQRKALRQTKNRFLRGLASSFLRQQGVDDLSPALQKKEVIRALVPEASCGPTSR